MGRGRRRVVLLAVKQLGVNMINWLVEYCAARRAVDTGYVCRSPLVQTWCARRWWRQRVVTSHNLLEKWPVRSPTRLALTDPIRSPKRWGRERSGKPERRARIVGTCAKRPLHNQSCRISHAWRCRPSVDALPTNRAGGRAGGQCNCLASIQVPAATAAWMPAYWHADGPQQQASIASYDAAGLPTRCTAKRAGAML